MEAIEQLIDKRGLLREALTLKKKATKGQTNYQAGGVQQPIFH